MKVKNRSRYTNKLLDDDPLERMKGFLSNLRNSLIFHGVFRTELARKSWVDEPCIGCDDAILLKAAAVGKVAYAKHSTFYARGFPTYRKNVDIRKRQSEYILSPEEKPCPQNLNKMISQMIKAVTSLPQYEADLDDGFQVLEAISRRFLDPRTERKRKRNRMMLIILSCLSVLLAAGYLYSRCRLT